MFGCLPDSKIIQDIDPFQKLWMYKNWEQDTVDKYELEKQAAYLAGSFVNPEAVRKMMGEGATKFGATDEEFDNVSKQIAKESKEEFNNLRKRKRKKIKEQRE